MRFILIILAIIAAVVIGLFLYGQLLEPDVRVIETEAVRADAG